MYSLHIFPKAKKELKKISIRHQKAVLETLKDLKEDPFIGKPLTRELTGRFSYKVGNYRIIYAIRKKDKIVEVFTAGHRGKVYN